MRKLLASGCVLALALVMAGADTSSQPAAPENLNVRIVGTASFQGRQTALIEDLNTHSDSFYRVGDPIYGYRIAEISSEGIYVEKTGKRYYVAFEATALRARAAEGEEKPVVANTYLPRQNSPVVPNLYLPGESPGQQTMPNFYSDAAKPTQWDLWTASPTAPAPAASKRVTADMGGRFAMPLANYKRLSSGFGYRDHPLGGGTKMHKGIDLAAKSGTKIYAADSGTVIWSGWRGGYGYCVIIDHHNGYTTTYGHCSKLVADTGDNVKRGDYIADVGSTGASTGPHLHFEIRNHDVPLNPSQYFKSSL